LCPPGDNQRIQLTELTGQGDEKIRVAVLPRAGDRENGMAAFKRAKTTFEGGASLEAMEMEAFSCPAEVWLTSLNKKANSYWIMIFGKEASIEQKNWNFHFKLNLETSKSMPVLGIWLPQIPGLKQTVTTQVVGVVIVSPPVTSPPVTSPPVASPPLASPPVTSPPVASSPVASPLVAKSSTWDMTVTESTSSETELGNTLKAPKFVPQMKQSQWNDDFDVDGIITSGFCYDLGENEILHLVADLGGAYDGPVAHSLCGNHNMPYTRARYRQKKHGDIFKCMLEGDFSFQSWHQQTQRGEEQLLDLTAGHDIKHHTIIDLCNELQAQSAVEDPANKDTISFGFIKHLAKLVLSEVKTKVRCTNWKRSKERVGKICLLTLCWLPLRVTEARSREVQPGETER